MHKKIRNKIREAVIWGGIAGALLFWFLDPILAGLIFAILLYMIIKVTRETILGLRNAQRMKSDGLELSKPIPAYFFLGSIRGDYPNIAPFSIADGTDPYVLFSKGEFLQLYQCQKHLYPGGSGRMDEHEIPYWLTSGVKFEVLKSSIVAIELHRMRFSQRTIETWNRNNSRRSVRLNANPLLRMANFSGTLCTAALTLVVQEGPEVKHFSFGVTGEFTSMINIPWDKLGPEWLQEIVEVVDDAREVSEWLELESESGTDKELAGFEKAKTMAAQIKEFLPHAQVRIIRKQVGAGDMRKTGSIVNGGQQDAHPQ